MAAEVLFLYCTPSSSMALASVEMDWKDITEVSNDIRDVALSIFEGLGLFCPEYGLIDYIRGHKPFTCGNQHKITVQYPAVSASGANKNASDGKEYINISISLSETHDMYSGFDEICQTNNIPRERSKTNDPDHLYPALSVRSVMRAANGLQGSVQCRMKIIRMRLCCFYILLHSRLSSESIMPYIRAGTSLVKDLVSLMTTSSPDVPFGATFSPNSSAANESDAEDAAIARSVAILAIECLIGLIESSHKRGGAVSLAFPESSILADLGLLSDNSMNDVLRPSRNTEGNNNSSTTPAWLVSFQAVCLEVDSFFSTSLEFCFASSSVVDRTNRAIIDTICEDEEEYLVDIECVSDGSNVDPYPNPLSGVNITSVVSEMVRNARYIRLMLELFVACITSIQLSGASVMDTSPVSSIVGLGFLLSSKLKQLLLLHAGFGLDVDDTNDAGGVTAVAGKSTPQQRICNELLWTLGKILLCLEVCVAGPDTYRSTFKECDGLILVSLVLEQYSLALVKEKESDNVLLLTHGCVDEAAFYVLENVLIVISHVFTHAHDYSSEAAIVNTSIGENGLQIAYQPFFEKLCCKIFESPYCVSIKFIWNHLVELYVAAINTEPAFLSHFLKSEACVQLMKRIKASADDELGHPLFKNGNGAFNLMIIKLAAACFITAPGQNAIVDNMVLERVISSVVHRELLYPQFSNTPLDSCSKIGRQLGYILKDSSATRRIIEKNMKSVLDSACDEVLRTGVKECDFFNRSCSRADLGSLTSLESARMQALQKLHYACVMVESVALEGRRPSSAADTLKNIVSVDVIAKLLACYRCTLPLPKQLFAQCSNPFDVHVTHLGYYPAARALTGVLKLSALSGLPAIMNSMEAALDSIRLHKSKLRHKNTCNSAGGDPEPISWLGFLNSIPQESGRVYSDALGSSVAGESLCIDEPGTEFDLWCVLSGIQEIEWLSSLLTPFMKCTNYQTARILNPNSSKAAFISLFDFHRSLLQELSRLCSTYFTAKEYGESLVFPSNYLEFRGDLYSAVKPAAPLVSVEIDPDAPVVDSEYEYVLRVVNHNGALIREGIDIETSRIVVLAPVGVELIAYERIMSSSNGVVRYRTAHGWLSEYRRDKYKEPLVELLDIRRRKGRVELNTAAADGGNLCKSPLPLRESVAYLFSRAHLAMKLLEKQVSRLMVLDHQMSRISNGSSRSVLYELAPQVGNMISCYCMKKLLVEHVDTPAEIGIKRTYVPSHIISPKVSSMSIEGQCLLVASSVKYMLSTLIEEKNEHVNVYLLKQFMDADNGLDCLCVALEDAIYIFCDLFEGASRAPHNSVMLDGAARASLLVIHSILVFFGKILPRTALNKSVVAKFITMEGNELGSDLFQMNQFLFTLYSKVFKCVFKIMDDVERKPASSFPLFILKEWLNVLHILSKNGLIPLPPSINGRSRGISERSDNSRSRFLRERTGLMPPMEPSVDMGSSLRRRSVNGVAGQSSIESEAQGEPSFVISPMSVGPESESEVFRVRRRLSEPEVEPEHSLPVLDSGSRSGDNTTELAFGSDNIQSPAAVSTMNSILSNNLVEVSSPLNARAEEFVPDERGLTQSLASDTLDIAIASSNDAVREALDNLALSATALAPPESIPSSNIADEMTAARVYVGDDPLTALFDSMGSSQRDPLITATSTAGPPQRRRGFNHSAYMESEDYRAGQSVDHRRNYGTLRSRLLRSGAGVGGNSWRSRNETSVGTSECDASLVLENSQALRLNASRIAQDADKHILSIIERADVLYVWHNVNASASASIAALAVRNNICAYYQGLCMLISDFYLKFEVPDMHISLWKALSSGCGVKESRVSTFCRYQLMLNLLVQPMTASQTHRIRDRMCPNEALRIFNCAVQLLKGFTDVDDSASAFAHSLSSSCEAYFWCIPVILLVNQLSTIQTKMSVFSASFPSPAAVEEEKSEFIEQQEADAGEVNATVPVKADVKSFRHLIPIADNWSVVTDILIALMTALCQVSKGADCTNLSCTKGTTSGELTQAILMTLSYFVSDDQFTETFAAKYCSGATDTGTSGSSDRVNFFVAMLSMTSSCSFASSEQKCGLFSLLLTRCIESHPHELKLLMIGEIRKLLKKHPVLVPNARGENVTSYRLSLVHFLEHTEALCSKNSQVFVKAVRESTVLISRRIGVVSSSSLDNDETMPKKAWKMETFVELPEVPNNNVITDDNDHRAWCVSLCSPLIDAIICNTASLHSDSGNASTTMMYNLADLINVLSMCMHHSAALPQLLCSSEFFTSRMTACKTRCEPGASSMIHSKSFFSFLISNLLGVDYASNGSYSGGASSADILNNEFTRQKQQSFLKGVVKSSMQFLVKFSSQHRMFARRVVIDAIAKSLSDNIAPKRFAGDVEVKRIHLLARLANLCSLVVYSAKSNTVASGKSGNQNLCLEAVSYLFSKNVPNLLSLGLSSISLSHKNAAAAGDVFLETLEMLSRPKLLRQLEKSASSGGSAAVRRSASGGGSKFVRDRGMSMDEVMFNNEAVTTTAEASVLNSIGSESTTMQDAELLGRGLAALARSGRRNIRVVDDGGSNSSESSEEEDSESEEDFDEAVEAENDEEEEEDYEDGSYWNGDDFNDEDEDDIVFDASDLNAGNIAGNSPMISPSHPFIGGNRNFRNASRQSSQLVDHSNVFELGISHPDYVTPPQAVRSSHGLGATTFQGGLGDILSHLQRAGGLGAGLIDHIAELALGSNVGSENELLTNLVRTLDSDSELASEYFLNNQNRMNAQASMAADHGRDDVVPQINWTADEFATFGGSMPLVPPPSGGARISSQNTLGFRPLPVYTHPLLVAGSVAQRTGSVDDFEDREIGDYYGNHRGYADRNTNSSVTSDAHSSGDNASISTTSASATADQRREVEEELLRLVIVEDLPLPSDSPPQSPAASDAAAEVNSNSAEPQVHSTDEHESIATEPGGAVSVEESMGAVTEHSGAVTDSSPIVAENLPSAIDSLMVGLDQMDFSSIGVAPTALEMNNSLSVDTSTALNAGILDSNDGVQMTSPPVEPAATEPSATAESVEATEHVHEIPAEGVSGLIADSGLVCPPGYDFDVFNFLPVELQQEAIEQNADTNSNVQLLVESSGYDYDTFQALPESIQQEILEQARRDAGASSSSGVPAETAAPSDVDNAAFLESLPEELRREVLLSADEAFMATLTPEWLAEANTVREAAAEQWQQMELRQAAEAEHREQRMRAAQAHRESRGDRSGLSSGTVLGRPVVNVETPVVAPDGSMLITSDNDVKSKLVPVALLPVLVKVLCCTYQSFSYRLIYKLLFNLMKHSNLRDIVLRLLTVLLLDDEESSQTLIQSIIGSLGSLLAATPDNPISDCSIALWQKELNNVLTVVKDRREVVTFATDVDSRSIKHGQMQTSGKMSPAVITRILSSLQDLCTINEGVVFDMLKDREGFAGRMGSVLGGESSNSLLELLIQLFASDMVCNNSVNLAVVAKLVDSLCEPLERITAGPVAAIATEDTANPISNGEEKRAAVSSSSSSEAAGAPPDVGLTPASLPNIVRIPCVTLAKDSLHSLCEVLLYDTCSKAVFDHITKSISRLAKVEANCTILKDVLVEVLGDLVSQSQMKLSTLHDALIVSITEGINSNAVSESNGGGSPKQLPLSIAASGNKHHERMLRTLQTLKCLIEKTSNPGIPSLENKSLSSVVNSNDLFHSEWSMLDKVLVQLRYYLVDEEDEESKTAKKFHASSSSSGGSYRSGSNSGAVASCRVNQSNNNSSGGRKAKKPQTTLSSFLLRLLPVIEAFCLLYANDILTIEGGAKAPLIRSASGTFSAPRIRTPQPNEMSTGSANSADSPNATASIVTAAAVSAAVSTASKSNLVLGAKYRYSTAYRSHNINLFAAEDAEEDNKNNAIGLNHTNSVSNTKSFRRVTSSNFYSLKRQTSHGSIYGSTNSLSNIFESSVSGTPLLSPPQQLLYFVQQHSGLLNLLIRAKPALLDESMSALIRVVQLRPHLLFEHKKRYFYDHLKKYQWPRSNSSRSHRSSTVHLQVRRDRVFEESFHQFRSKSGEELRGRLQVNFEGEEGIDAGGLAREWYQVVARDIFNPNYVLFSAVADGATFQPNPMSMININHLDYFKFVGRVIGKAVVDKQLMDAHFTRSFYKHLLGVPVDYHDIEALEPDYYKSLKQILELPMDVLGIELTFSAETQTFGKHEIVDLIPNGRQILVTDDNKADYVRLITKHRMTTAIKSQIESFMDGFYEIVPPELVCIFSPTELELLICGLPDVDIEELRINTEYQQFSVSDPYIAWFWDILRSFSREEKALFLQFVTGTSKVSALVLNRVCL